MNRILFKAIAMITLFLALWLSLGRLDWMDILNVKETTHSTEEKFGEMLWDFFKSGEEEIESEEVKGPIDSMLVKICEANGINREDIKLHVLNKDEVNAFALPGNRMVIFSGLIMEAESAGEVAGVIGHELAHMQLNHVMKKLIKEIGLSAIITIAGGSQGGEIMREAARLISSTAYDRKLEKEADMASVDYLINAKIDPEGFAHFLYRLADLQPEGMQYLTWMNTHPDSRERAEYIIEYAKDGEGGYEPVIQNATWEALRDVLSNEPAYQE